MGTSAAHRIRLVALVIATMAATTATAPAIAATARPAADFEALSTQARSTFAGTLRGVSALPKAQRSLVSLISSAEKAAPDRPCDALRLLRTVRSRISSTGLGRRTTLGRKAGPQLEAATLATEAALLVRPGTKACGGGAPAPAQGEAETEVVTSSAGGLRLKVSLPKAQFSEAGGLGLRFPELTMAGMPGIGPVGAPASPSLPLVIAIPTGATAQVAVRASGYQLRGVEPFPVQPLEAAVPPDPEDPFFKIERFRASRTAYQRTTPTPTSFASVKKLPAVGGLNLALVRLNGAQSTPAAGRLRVATALDVSVRFTGATDGSFGSAELLSEFQKPAATFLATTVVNWSTVKDKLRAIPPRPLCGEEMMIITAADLRPAADRLAAARTRGGVISRVFEVGSGPGQIGTTPSQIRSAINNEVNANCAVKPGHILMFGDAGRVPTFSVPTAVAGNDYYSNIPSDLPYTPFAFILPLGAVGRLPVSTLDNANVVVDKLVAYADNPPADNDFYNRAAVAGYFQIKAEVSTTQESRGFAQSAEEIRATLVGNGRTVQRIYNAKPEANPKKFQNGTSVPASLQKPTFAWDADNADIAAAWNAGRFSFFHIDHGGVDGWSAPVFGRADVDALTNTTELPVLFSLNCLTGQLLPVNNLGMDGRAVIRGTGGAVGAMAPSVVSWGEMRDTYPAILTAMYGNSSGASLSQGWVVTAARFQTIIAGTNAANAKVIDNGRLWNFLGDPSLPFWANGTPRRFNAGDVQYSGGGTKVTVNAVGADAAGTEVTIVNATGQALARKTLPGPGTYELALDGWAPANGLVGVRAKPGFVSRSDAVGS